MGLVSRAGRPGVLTALALAIVSASAGAQTEEELENRLKTEFIERFTQFIEWPAGARANADRPFVVGVYGKTALARSLRELVRRQPIKGFRGTLVEVREPDEAADCDLLFIAETARDDLGEVLARTGDRPVLTIGDTPGFARRGVLINFVRDGDRLRFEVNKAAAEQSGLRFSSKLLRLATLVPPEPRP